MAGYWIKLYQEILDDRKMCQLSDHLYRRCIELFLLAGDQDDSSGVLPPIEDIAWRLRTNEEQLLADLQELAKTGIISNQNGAWVVTNFAKRQAPVEPDERMRRCREARAKQQYRAKPDQEQAESVAEIQPDDSDDAVTNRNASCYESVTNRNNDCYEDVTNRNVDKKDKKDKIQIPEAEPDTHVREDAPVLRTAHKCASPQSKSPPRNKSEPYDSKHIPWRSPLVDH